MNILIFIISVVRIAVSVVIRLDSLWFGGDVLWVEGQFVGDDLSGVRRTEGQGLDDARRVVGR